MNKGDTEKQANLRDKMIKKGSNIYESPYIRKILSILTDTMSLLDIGCGTGHIIQGLALHNSLLVGMDISPAMLKIARDNTADLRNIIFVQGDGLNLPFYDCTFDVVITRLADYSVEEAYRVLKKGGYFIEYGLGPHADKEIAEFFPERIEEESFFFPETKEWKKEVCESVENAHFFVNSIEDYQEKDYYQSEEDLMDLIEMVPLVKDFDREKDRKIIDDLSKKYRGENGIEITWHYYVVEAQRV